MDKTIINQLMKSLITEGKKEDLYDIFLNKSDIFFQKYSTEEKNLIFSSLWDMDKTPSKKMLTWYLKIIKNIGDVHPDTLIPSFSRILDNFKKIESSINKKLIDGFKQDVIYYVSNDETRAKYLKILESPKDINVYPDISSLRELSSYIKNETFSKEQKKRAKEESIKLYEDSKYLVIRPLSYDASCVYGKGTKWCISSKESSTHFNNYIEENTFIFVIDKQSNDRRYSKFAIQIPKKSKSNVVAWDQQDISTTLDTVYEKMPGMEEILTTILNVVDSEYQILLNIKKGKINSRSAFIGHKNIEAIKNDVFINFDGFEDYMRKIFKRTLGSESIDMLSYMTSRYSDYEFVDYYTAKDDFEEGYALNDLSDDGKQMLSKIIKFLNPSLYEKLKKNNIDSLIYFSEAAKTLKNHNKYYDNLITEYGVAKDSGYSSGVEKAIPEEYCDTLKLLNVEMVKCFGKYKTTIDNLLSLYEESGNKSLPIIRLLAEELDKYSVADISENYYEYFDDDEYISRWHKEADYILERYVDLLEEENEEFSNDEYQNTVDYVINNFGFNVKKEIPTQKGTYFSIISVESDSRILVEITKQDGERKKIFLTIQQLESLLKNYKLFDVV